MEKEQMWICPEWKTCDCNKVGNCKVRSKPHLRDAESKFGHVGCSGHFIYSDCVPYIPEKAEEQPTGLTFDGQREQDEQEALFRSQSVPSDGIGTRLPDKQKLKIYLASSWKNAEGILIITNVLRQKGFQVDAFCDQQNGRIGFNIADELQKSGAKLSDVDCISALAHPAVNKMFKVAFDEDKKWLDWCNCVIMCLPCGKSAHLEAGYAKGQGKLFYIYSLTELPKGEFDNMYQFADGIFRREQLPNLIKALEEG